MKRPARWQLEKQRTAKAMRELPLCERCGIRKAMGAVVTGAHVGEAKVHLLCPQCAREAQRAQRERT